MEENAATKSVSSTAFDKITQFLLPALTITGFLLISLKKPQFGLVVSLFAQVFWVYSGWQSWRKASQIGVFVTVCVMTLVIIYGVINYWFF